MCDSMTWITFPHCTRATLASESFKRHPIYNVHVYNVDNFSTHAVNLHVVNTENFSTYVLNLPF
uniref:Uncharacterized protein n=1 Tax=Rhizophora mucronata TaxID=61149 RepID=A0A2P2NCB5_RHIMU